MGAEGNDGLALPVVFLDKRIDSHRHFAPPIGITDENDIVILYGCIALNGQDAPWLRVPVWQLPYISYSLPDKE